MLEDHRAPVGDDSAGGVVAQPAHHLANIEHTALVAEGLDDVEAAAFVDVETDGVGEHRLGGDEVGLEPVRQPELPDRQLRLVRRLFHARLPDRQGILAGRGSLLVRRNCQSTTGQRKENGASRGKLAVSHRGNVSPGGATFKQPGSSHSARSLRVMPNAAVAEVVRTGAALAAVDATTTSPKSRNFAVTVLPPLWLVTAMPK